MKYWLLFLMVTMVMLNSRTYPIPVDCRSAFHAPTIAAPIVQTFGYLKHVGIDYDVETGTDVYAVMDGIVITVYQDSRVYGRSIYLLHCDGYMSLYAHLSETKVKFGQIVKSGQIIGLSGGELGADGAGWSSGAHLHFEVRVPGHLENNLYNIDPAKYAEMVGKYNPVPVWDWDRYDACDCFMKG